MVVTERLELSKEPLLRRQAVPFATIPRDHKNGGQGRNRTDFFSITNAVFTHMNFETMVVATGVEPVQSELMILAARLATLP